MSYRVAAAFAAALSICLAQPSAKAGVLDRLHDQAVEGGRMCFPTHWHFNSSGAWHTQAEAMAVARRGWERFTETEYGEQWGSLRLAAGTDYGCSIGATPRGQMWSCNLKARPCRKL